MKRVGLDNKRNTHTHTFTHTHTHNARPDLKLVGFDDKSKIKVIKEVRAISGLGLKEVNVVWVWGVGVGV